MFRFFLFFLLLPITLFAQVPANDLCANAIDIFCGDALTGTTIEATEVDEPTNICGVSNNGSSGVWYSFTGTGDIVTVSLCGSDFDTQLQVFEGNCNNQVCIGGNDDACGLQSEFLFTSDVSTDYLFYINGFGAETGNFNIQLTCINPFDTIIVNSINDPETQLTAEELIEQVLINPFVCGDVDITVTNIAENPEGVSDIAQRSWGYFNSGDTNFPISEGIILSSGFAQSAEGPNDTGGISDSAQGWSGDIDLQAILDNQLGTTVATNNATVFEFEFASNLTQVTFDFVFASEEYEDQFECTDNFRDGFAFLIKGPGISDDSGTPFGGTNIAVINGSNNVPVSTVSIHSDTFMCGDEVAGVNFFPDLYLSNVGANTDNFPTQFDGLTMALTTATLSLMPNETYTAKLVIADRGDSSFDSAVFLAGGSFDIGTTAPGADSELPVVTCPGDQTVEVLKNTPFLLPDYVGEGIVVSTDNCGLFTTVQTPAPGTEIGAGTETIEFEAIDQGGNSQFCSFILQVDEILSTDEFELNNQINLFPNPAKNYTSIESPFAIENVVIYSISGRIVDQIKSNSLNIQDLSSGVYFVEIATEEGTVVKQLIVK